MPDQQSNQVRSFQSGGKTFDIPINDTQAFLADMPDAKEIRSFISGKDTLDIPFEKVQEFLTDMPDAKPLHDYRALTLEQQNYDPEAGQPQTFMQKELRDKGLIQDNSVVKENLSTEQPKEEQGFIGKIGSTVGNSFMTGMNSLNSWAADAPAFIYDLAGAPFRAVGLNVPTSQDFKDTPLQGISDFYKGNAKAYEQKVEQANPSRGNGVIASFENGDIEGGVLNLLGGIAESAPASIAMMLSGGATAPTIIGGAAIFGAGKAQEMDENAPEMDYDKRRVIAALNGTLEGVFETYLGSGAVGKSLAGIIKNEGKEVAQQSVKRSMSTLFAGMITKNPWLAPLGEGLEEVGTQISQNFVDKFSGYKPNLNLTDGVGDSFLSGVGMGGIHGAVIGLAKKAMEDKQQPSGPVSSDTTPQFTVDPRQTKEAELRQQAEGFASKTSGNIQTVEIITMEGTENIPGFVTGSFEQTDPDGKVKTFYNIREVNNPNVTHNTSSESIIEVGEQSIDDFVNGQMGIYDQTTQQQELLKKNQVQIDGIQYILTGDQTKEGYVAINPEDGTDIVIPANTIDNIRNSGQENANVVTQNYGKTQVSGIKNEDGSLSLSDPATEEQANSLKAQVEQSTGGKATVQADLIPNEDVTAPQQFQLSIIPKVNEPINNESITTLPVQDNELTQEQPIERKITTQTIGKTPIDIIEGEEFDEVVPSDKMPLEKALPILENEFKDNEDFNVVAERVQVEIPAENKYKKPTFQTVIKSIKIVPVAQNTNNSEVNAENVTNAFDQLFDNQLPIVNNESDNSQNNQLQNEDSEKVIQPTAGIVAEEGENTPQAQQGQGNKEGLEENVNKIQSWTNKWEELKAANDIPELEMFYNKVKVALNGYAQGYGEDVVTEFQSLKKDIENYAEELKNQNIISTDQPVVESLTADPVADEITQAVKEVNTNPSEAQKEAGNYKMAHVKVQGMDISIENPKGSFRKGVDEDGKSWETEMKSHYGYFKGTIGKDGDHVDTFIGENPESNWIFVVDQNNPKDGTFDESKVMLGFNSIEEANAAYLSNYEPNWKGLRGITAVPVDQFKEWLYDGAKQRKPFAEYKGHEELLKLEKANAQKAKRQAKQFTPEEAKQRAVDRAKALNIEPTSLEQLILQYFASGHHRIDRDELKKELFPRAPKEMRGRIWLWKIGGERIDKLINIADGTPFEEEAHSMNGIRNAILGVIFKYPKLGDMVDGILEIGDANNSAHDQAYYENQMGEALQAQEEAERNEAYQVFEENAEILDENITETELIELFLQDDAEPDRQPENDEGAVLRADQGVGIENRKDGNGSDQGDGVQAPTKKGKRPKEITPESEELTQLKKIRNTAKNKYYKFKTELERNNEQIGLDGKVAGGDVIGLGDNKQSKEIVNKAKAEYDEAEANVLALEKKLRDENINRIFNQQALNFDTPAIPEARPPLNNLLEDAVKAREEKKRPWLNIDRLKNLIAENPETLSDGKLQKLTSDLNTFYWMYSNEDLKSMAEGGFIQQVGGEYANPTDFVPVEISLQNNLNSAIERAAKEVEKRKALPEEKQKVEPIFPKEHVTDSFSHVHMSPHNTAKVEENEWNNNANELQETIKKYVPEISYEELSSIINQYKADYLKNRERVWNTASVTVSSAVAGRSNFNAKQADQRGNALDRAYEAFNLWNNKEVARIEGISGVEKAKAEEKEIKAKKKSEAEAGAKVILVKKWTALKVGDKLDIGNPNGNPTITKKNKFSVETNGGAKWSLKEVYGVDHAEAQKIMDDLAGTPEVKAPEKKNVMDIVLGFTYSTTETFNEKSFDEFNRALAKGEVGVEEFKKAFEVLLSSKEAIISELNGMTKAELLKGMSGMGQYRYKNEKKDATVKAIWSDHLMDFAFGSISYSFDGTSMDQIVAKKVAGTTQKNIDDFVAETQKRKEEYIARVQEFKKALTNPETLSEFKIFIDKNGLDKLSPEQKAAYDNLVTDKVIDKRNEAIENKAVVGKVDLAGVEMDITETKHTKTGADLFVVKLSERVSKEDYQDLNSKAKQLGGYYSSFRGQGAVPGFQFKTREQAQKFVDLKKEDASNLDLIEEKQDTKLQDRVSKLRDNAQKIIDRVDTELSKDRLTNTAKRASEAASAEARLNKEKQIAQTMMNIADAIENGDVKLLDGVKAKTHIELLDGLVRQAKSKEMSAKYPSYSERMSHEGEPVTSETLEYSKDTYFPNIYSDHIKSLVDKVGHRSGVKLIASRWSKRLDQSKNKDYYQISSQGEVDELTDMVNALMGNEKSYNRVAEEIADYNRLKSMGIENDSMLRAALREYVQYRGKSQEVDKVKKLERALVGRKNIGIDFFPTPKETAKLMVDEAGIEEGMSVLEPSAGNGNIADAIKETGVQPDVIELSSALSEVLEAKGYDVVASDFMEFSGKTYDRIVMNPPFSNGMDGDHVMHAYDLLNPGGKLVAIVGEGTFIRNDKKAVAFREWLDSVGGTEEKLNQGTFQDKTLLNTTGANARLVVIEKPNDTKFRILGETGAANDNSTDSRSLITDLEAAAKYQSDVHYMDKAEAAKFAKGKVSDVAVSEIKKVNWMGLAIDNNIIINPSVTDKIQLFRTWAHEKAHIQIRNEFPSFRAKKVHFIEMFKRIAPEELTRVLGDNYVNKPDYIQAEEYYTHLAEEYAISGDIKGENVQPEIKNHIFDIVDGFISIKTIKDVINNYNRTSQRNPEVERNTGGKGIADQSSNRGNTLDEGNGRTTGQSPARIDRSLPLTDYLSQAKQSVLAKKSDVSLGEKPMTEKSFQEIFQERHFAIQDLKSNGVKRLQVNSDATVTVYHGTSKSNWDKIQKEGFSRQSYFSVHKTGTQYGDSPLDVAKRKFGNEGIVVEVKIDPRHLSSAAAGSELYAENALIPKDGHFEEQQSLPNTILIDGKLRSTVNSKGLPIAQTEEGIRNFWKWFGGSKVVDKQGRPLVVYHGTKYDFSEFDPKEIGKQFGDFSIGFNFINNPNVADNYGNSIMPVYIKAINPLEIIAGQEGVTHSIDIDRGYLASKIIKSRESNNPFDSIISKDSDGNIQVVAFSPSQIKSATGNNGSFSPDDNNINFKKEVREPLDTFLANAAEQYQEKKKTRRNLAEVKEKVREFIQDHDLPIRRLEEKVKALGGTIKDNMKPYRDMSNSYGRNETLYKSFSKDKMEPVIKTISKIIKSGVSGIEVLPYMISKHAIERNAYMRENEFKEWEESAKADLQKWTDANIDIPQATKDRKVKEFNDESQAKRAELQKKDYSGVKGFDPENRFDNPDELAQNIVDEFEDKVSVGLVDELWENVKEASSDIVNFWKAGQTMSAEQAEITKNRFKYFIPLRGWREGAAKQLAYKKGDGFASSLQRAKGRTSFAENPLAYLQQTAFKAIGEQVDNEVKTSLLNLVTGNYDAEFQKFYHLKKAYYVKVNLPDGSFEWEMTMERPSEEMFASGDAKTKIYEQYQKLRTPAQAHEHEIYIKRPNGDMIVVMSDEMLPVAQAMNHKNTMYRNLFTGQINDAEFWNKPLSATFGVLNNSLKAMYTAWNVVFPLTNFARDIQEASITQFIKGDSGHMVLANYRNTFPAIIRDLRGKTPTGKYGMMLQEFRSVGGNTGFTHLKTPEELEKEIKADLNIINRKGTFRGYTLDQLIKVKGGIEAWNQVFEDATRFSVYITSRENGKSMGDAASDAKEASVNFNRKGKSSKAFDSIWAFWNVAIQSMQKNMKLAKDHPGRFGIVAGSWLALGFLEAMFNDWAGGDDDEDYFNISEYVRENYLIIPNLPALISGEKSDKYLRIPLPQFWRGFKSAGSLAYDVMNGKMDVLSATGKGLSNFMGGMLPIDMGGFIQDGEFSIAPIVPTIYRTINEIDENRDYKGFKIAKEPFTKEQQMRLADSGLGKDNVNPAIKFCTDWLFRTSGGDNENKFYTKDGVIKKVPGFLDINPSMVEHLITGYTGGTGRFIDDALTTAIQAINPETEVDFKNAPFLNSFFKKIPEAKWKIIGEYYDLKSDGNESKFDALKTSYFNQEDKTKFKELAPSGYYNEFNATLDAYDEVLTQKMKYMDYKTAEGSEEVTNTMKDAINAIKEVKQKYNR